MAGNRWNQRANNGSMLPTNKTNAMQNTQELLPAKKINQKRIKKMFKKEQPED